MAWTDDSERLKTLLVRLNGPFRPYRHNTYVNVYTWGPNSWFYRVSRSFLLFYLSPLGIQRSAAAARSGVRPSTITALPCPSPLQSKMESSIVICSCTSWAEGNPSVWTPNTTAAAPALSSPVSYCSSSSDVAHSLALPASSSRYYSFFLDVHVLCQSLTSSFSASE
jgi:hypothetical protein